MTSYLIDSGFLYALVDANDVHHTDVLEERSVISGRIILPIPAITEVCYFVRRNLGGQALASFLKGLSETDELVFEPPTSADFARAAEILRIYLDNNIDFVDACIFAMAERLNITKILTVDRRHFSVFRPKHCDVFELIP
jgi:predicted nucleic acid-binding protein